MIRSLLLGLAAAGLSGLLAFAPVERAEARVPSAQPTARTAAADTLRFEVSAGDPLIVALPARVGGLEATYSVEEAPALSWLVDRSFFYRTVPGERGQLAIRLRQQAGEQSAMVVIFVTITA